MCYNTKYYTRKEIKISLYLETPEDVTKRVKLKGLLLEAEFG